jgi:hypothetical protein
MEPSIINLLLTVGNAFFCYSNYKGKNYKWAIFSGFVTGFSFAIFLHSLKQLL